MSDDDKITRPPYIKNYGIFWKRDDVFWGDQGRGNPGNLLGKKKNNKKSDAIDFRKQVGFYALYDKNRKFVYFGQVGKQELFNRLKQHKNQDTSGRWFYFSWFGTRRVKKTNNQLSIKAAGIQGKHPDLLNQIEAMVIEVAEPQHNKQGGRFNGAEEYLQHKDK